MSTGMEMQRLSRGAEGLSRDVGFTGSPGETNAHEPALRPTDLKLGLESGHLGQGQSAKNLQNLQNQAR